MNRDNEGLPKCPKCWTPTLVSLSGAGKTALCLRCAYNYHVACARRAQAKHRTYLVARVSYERCLKRNERNNP